jgi:hypothetical protein
MTDYNQFSYMAIKKSKRKAEEMLNHEEISQDSKSKPKPLGNLKILIITF